MPIYEYRCLVCEHVFEEWQKITDKPIHTCPTCQKQDVERLISGAAFQLKGRGFYKDSYSSSTKSSSSKPSSTPTT